MKNLELPKGALILERDTTPPSDEERAREAAYFIACQASNKLIEGVLGESLDSFSSRTDLLRDKLG